MTDAALHTLEVEGPPGARRVVFLHGLFGQGRNFTQVAKALAGSFSATLVDLPDHGRSPWTDAFSYEAMADAVAGLLGEDAGGAGGAGGSPPVHLVGHSMGGKVAMLVALRHPELVDRLVVVDIAPAPSEGAGEFVHLLDSLAALDLTALTRRSDAEDALREAIPAPGVRAFLLQNLRSGEDGWRWQANLAMLRRDLPAITGWPEVAPGTVFDRPVLWLAGERSAYVGPEHEAAMRALFPRTRLVTVKGAGHWVHSEQPEAFVSALRVFLGADQPRAVAL